MAVDTFLKLDGIEGEARDSVHAKEIDVLSWSWGVTQSGTTQIGGGTGSGKCNVHDLSFVKYIDSATNMLFQRSFDGLPIAEGILVVRKAGGDALEYLKITMTDIIVSSVNTGGSGEEDRLTENVSLSFAKVELAYVPQNESGGGEGEKLAGWHIAENLSLV